MRFQHSSLCLALPGNQKAKQAGIPITQALGARSLCVGSWRPPSGPPQRLLARPCFPLLLSSVTADQQQTRQAQHRSPEAGTTAREHGAKAGPGGSGTGRGGGKDLLRLPLPAAAGAAAAGPGHRGDGAGLPHGEHQPLPASQRHSVLGWDHCKHQVCSSV